MAKEAVTQRQNKNERPPTSTTARIALERSGSDGLLIKLSGPWKLDQGIPSADAALNAIAAAPSLRSVAFDTTGMDGWDSALLTFLTKISVSCVERNIRLENDGLPQGSRRLLALASAMPERKGARRNEKKETFMSLVGAQTLSFFYAIEEMITFTGEVCIAFAKLLVGKATFRRADLLALMQECGSNALPIVSLICLLVGLIIAFIGAVQLKMFGAQIYVADLVAVGMVRVMAAIMTGIILAGRTGAAFAAELGTMQVNEEIDALQTLGISPIEYLVLPRMIALVVMMPLLCLYANLLALTGGLIVGVGMLDLGLTEYLIQTRGALSFTNLWIGLIQGTVFGAIVALAGCLRGMQCGRSASAVGGATTSAVVTSIVGIIVATALVTVICQIIGV